MAEPGGAAIQRRDAILFESLSANTFGDDLLSVFKSINAFQGFAGDKALEGAMRSRVAGKVITLDNMANSSFYKRPVRAQPAGSRDLISSGSSKESGLYKHSGTVQYSDFADLASMWSIYARSAAELVDSIGLDECPAGIPLVEHKHFVLCRTLELTGSRLTISDSSNAQIVGLSGIVIRDQQNVFHIFSENNKVRVIPKDVCTFTLEITPGRILTFRGIDLVSNSPR